MTTDTQIFRLEIRETDTYDLLYIAGCIGYEEKKEAVEESVVKSEAGVQTEIRRRRHMGTSCPIPSYECFSSQVSETILFDEFNSPDTNKELTFNDKALIMSRILASNVWKPFRNALNNFKNNPMDMDVEFSYTVFVLGELKDPKLKSAQVTAIARNSEMEYLFAAGFSAGNAGGVALVSLKNMLRAEKIYRLRDAVLCLSFSETNPNLLAAGTSRGGLWVFDVSKRSFEPLHTVPGAVHDVAFAVAWWDNCIVWNNGNKILRLDRQFITSKTETIMNVPYSSSKNLLLTPGPKVTGFLRHPVKTDEYVVSGTDGALRYCSVNNKLEILDVIADAHMEIISGIRSVPHCAQMFLTFGCDGTVKLWAWAVKEALIVFKTEEHPIELRDACWSPSHATVVASCSPNKIFIWDVHRRTHAPVSVTDTRYTCLNIQFSASGEFLIIGTAEGSVMFLGLGLMPFPEKLKKLAFKNAILREMIASGTECEKIFKHFSD